MVSEHCSVGQLQSELAVLEVVGGRRAVVQPLEHVSPREEALVEDAQELRGGGRGLRSPARRLACAPPSLLVRLEVERETYPWEDGGSGASAGLLELRKSSSSESTPSNKSSSLISSFLSTSIFTGAVLVCSPAAGPGCSASRPASSPSVMTTSSSTFGLLRAAAAGESSIWAAEEELGSAASRAGGTECDTEYFFSFLPINGRRDKILVSNPLQLWDVWKCADWQQCCRVGPREPTQVRIGGDLLDRERSRRARAPKPRHACATPECQAASHAAKAQWVQWVPTTQHPCHCIIVRTLCD